MGPNEFFQYVGEVRVIGLLRTPVPESAPPAIEAAVAGGVRVIEISMNTAGAGQMLGRFADRADSIIGAGTVLTPDDAKLAIDQGARFLTSPVVSEPVLKVAAEAGVAMIPGTNTPTEMARAMRGRLAAYRQAEDLVMLGAYERGSDPDVDAALCSRDASRAFLQQLKLDGSTLDDTLASMQHVVAAGETEAVR